MSEIVPAGWWHQTALPEILARDSFADLDEWADKLRFMADRLEAIGGNGFEYEAASRVLDKRRGDLLLEPPNTRVNGSLRVSAMTESRWRMIARHWDDVIYPHLVKAKRREQVTQAQCLRLTREHTPAAPDIDLPDAESGDERIRLLHGDFRDRLRELEPGSVDLIVTDPPYPKDDLPLWRDLGKVAADLLGARGLLFAWTGQIFLPAVIEMLSESLAYGWTFSLQLPGSGSRIMGRHIVQAWKPVLAFSTGTWPSGEWGDDLLLSPERQKDDYAWQQHAAPAQRLIDRYSAPDGLVVDPFLGVGSFGCAARDTGRRFVGVELDAGRFRKAEQNIIGAKA